MSKPKKSFSKANPTTSLEGVCIYSQIEGEDITVGIAVDKDLIKPSLFRAFKLDQAGLTAVKAQILPSRDEDNDDQVVLFLRNKTNYLYKASEKSAEVGQTIIADFTVNVVPPKGEYKTPMAFFNLKKIETITADALLDGDEQGQAFFAS